MEWSGIIRNTSNYHCSWTLPISLTIKYLGVWATHATYDDPADRMIKWNFITSTLSVCQIENNQNDTNMDQCILIFGL